MIDFTVHFLISNIAVSIIALLILCVRHVLKNSLTGRTRYRLWFLLLCAMTIPFLPIAGLRFPQIASWLKRWSSVAAAPEHRTVAENALFSPASTYGWMDDLSISVSSKAPSPVVFLLFTLWLFGILAVSLRLIRAAVKLRRLKGSAMPLQSDAVRVIYRNCLEEMKITREIPIYSTAFLSSPVITGLFRPRIYLPIGLISDFHASGLHAAEVRYMLLHELQHYRHMDGFATAWMNLAQMLYWFNPLVLYALKEMRCDREIACDESVLGLLKPEDLEPYGNTLINYAEKVSLTPFPFATYLSGSMEQLKKRILCIASFSPASPGRKAGNLAVFLCIAVLLSCFLPVLSAGAGNRDRYVFPENGQKVTYVDYSDVFGKTQGSFVLYDTARDTWTIHDREAAFTRIPPASTYKIYAALHALENGIITAKQSLIAWDGTEYPYVGWNADQTLESAMANSVNWYFQALDRQTDMGSVREFIRKIGYGNQLVTGDLSSYWLDSSLKISPVEQVELLRKFHDGLLPFQPENVTTVKDAICLAATENGTLYGKTGTEAVDGKNISGWFIGYVENGEGTYYFATNIQSEDSATGTAATALAFEILAKMGVWRP